MTNASKVVLVIVGLALTLGIILVYGLFHGDFDRGRFEVKQIQWSSAKQVAMVVERSDQQALNSYIYFVLIGDHVFSPAQLRHKYYSDAVVFAAADNCLNLHWRGATTLVIACDGHTLTRQHVDVEKHQSGGVAILYDNIPSELSQM